MCLVSVFSWDYEGHLLKWLPVEVIFSGQVAVQDHAQVEEAVHVVAAVRLPLDRG